MKSAVHLFHMKPLSQKDIKQLVSHGPLRTEELSAWLRAHRNHRRDRQCAFLTTDDVWPTANGVRRVLRAFRSKYGAATLAGLAAYSLQKSHVRARNGLTKQEVKKAMSVMSMMMAALNLARGGVINGWMHQDGDVRWFASDISPVAH